MLGYFDNEWSLRQAHVALRAHRENRWDEISYQLCVLVNNQPHFGSGPRPFVPQWRFNPMAKRPQQSEAELDAGFDALWSMAEDRDEGSVKVS